MKTNSTGSSPSRSPYWPERAYLLDIFADAQGFVKRIGLPFRNSPRHGAPGVWLGSGAGNSIDFKDHRPYVPGDDPRYINWAAYARTEQYTMKLYREEVSPRLDILFDVSDSMLFEGRKKRRSFQLFYFCIESALSAGASIRVYLTCGSSWETAVINSIRAGDWCPAIGIGDGSNLSVAAAIPWRQGAMRIFISDLLYPDVQEHLLIPLASRNGQGYIFAPYNEEESAPDWQGNLEIMDCETTQHTRCRVNDRVYQRYQSAYQLHFETWRRQCRKYAVGFHRVPSTGTFMDAVTSESSMLGIACGRG